MEDVENPILDQISLFSLKAEHTHEFTTSGIPILLKKLETYEEYLEVRPILEGVSRCYTVHPREYVEKMLSTPLFYPFIIQLNTKSNDTFDSSLNGTNDQKHKKIVAYFEIHVIPHLGRLFDSRLERVIVDPEYRNLGIFSELLNFTVRFCTSVLKCNRIDLTSENPIAIRMYEKIGFEKVDSNVYRKYL
ncbi:hypothetical protein BEWA_042920 [Theileria equi strain WA]|uniref:N-acetyltransferase domain-containing protein n=1 Tax=Theileria equi strain WA TaxID=1537102 RepID=L1LFY8_THEEQ|nr:hypothetical protein BEWA_042920 [Theileria equi strain WA]EKX74251.1 hypothetical protein BEWA_042920 [Theileria equi strain WA]|eukprot:XP_004833703.1 hypothetical protein BEWA_042920 [Theileria equi strain WA]